VWKLKEESKHSAWSRPNRHVISKRAVRRRITVITVCRHGVAYVSVFDELKHPLAKHAYSNIQHLYSTSTVVPETYICNSIGILKDNARVNRVLYSAVQKKKKRETARAPRSSCPDVVEYSPRNDVRCCRAAVPRPHPPAQAAQLRSAPHCVGISCRRNLQCQYRLEASVLFLARQVAWDGGREGVPV
jgi:hypothetical protein